MQTHRLRMAFLISVMDLLLTPLQGPTQCAQSTTAPPVSAGFHLLRERIWRTVLFPTLTFFGRNSARYSPTRLLYPLLKPQTPQPRNPIIAKKYPATVPSASQSSNQTRRRSCGAGLRVVTTSTKDVLSNGREARREGRFVVYTVVRHGKETRTRSRISRRRERSILRVMSMSQQSLGFLGLEVSAIYQPAMPISHAEDWRP